MNVMLTSWLFPNESSTKFSSKAISGGMVIRRLFPWEMNQKVSLEIRKKKCISYLDLEQLNSLIEISTDLLIQYSFRTCIFVKKQFSLYHYEQQWHIEVPQFHRVFPLILHDYLIDKLTCYMFNRIKYNLTLYQLFQYHYLLFCLSLYVLYRKEFHC